MDSSDDDDFVFEPSKNSTSKGTIKFLYPQNMTCFCNMDILRINMKDANCVFCIFPFDIIALPKSKPSEQTPKVERRPPSNYDSPVFLTDDDDDDDDDGCTITSTWKTRHSKPSVASPLTISHVPSPRPKTTCTKSKAWSSSDEQEEEVDSLLNRLKKNLRLHSDSTATPKNVPGNYNYFFFFLHYLYL